MRDAEHVTMRFEKGRLSRGEHERTIVARAAVALVIVFALASCRHEVRPAGIVFALERCWESGPARDSEVGCEYRFTLYDDGTFVCGGGAGRLGRRAVDRLRRVAESAHHTAFDGVTYPHDLLRRRDDADAISLAPGDMQEIERVMGALGTRCAL